MVAILIVVFVIGISSMINKIIVRYFGVEIIAEVIKVPESCSKNNSIRVILYNEEFNVPISRDNCIKKHYRVGDYVKLLRHKDFNNLEWPQSNPILALSLIIMVIVVGGIMVIKRSNSI